jgi:hypothetical protein
LEKGGDKIGGKEWISFFNGGSIRGGEIGGEWFNSHEEKSMRPKKGAAA